jgi:hypothetical protein
MSEKGNGVDVSLDMKWDVGDTINRLGSAASSGLVIFSEGSTYNLPEPGCVYPSGATADDMATAYNHAYDRRHYDLKWQMRADTYWPGDEMVYDLRISWEGLWFSSGNVIYNCLENITPRVELESSGWGWRLEVGVKFEKGYFLHQAGPDGYELYVAQVGVVFDVHEKDGSGEAVRDVPRGWTIFADRDGGETMFS